MTIRFGYQKAGQLEGLFKKVHELRWQSDLSAFLRKYCRCQMATQKQEAPTVKRYKKLPQLCCKSSEQIIRCTYSGRIEHLKCLALVKINRNHCVNCTHMTQSWLRVRISKTRRKSQLAQYYPLASRRTLCVLFD